MSLTGEQVAILATIIGAVIGAGVKGVWVWGWVYKALLKQLVDMTRDRDFWRDMALKSMGHTDKALDRIPETVPESPASDG